MKLDIGYSIFVNTNVLATPNIGFANEVVLSTAYVVIKNLAYAYEVLLYSCSNLVSYMLNKTFRRMLRG